MSVHVGDCQYRDEEANASQHKRGTPRSCETWDGWHRFDLQYEEGHCCWPVILTFNVSIGFSSDGNRTEGHRGAVSSASASGRGAINNSRQTKVVILGLHKMEGVGVGTQSTAKPGRMDSNGNHTHSPPYQPDEMKI